MIPLRHANEHWACLLVGVDRKLPGSVEPARMTLSGPACARGNPLAASRARLLPGERQSACVIALHQIFHDNVLGGAVRLSRLHPGRRRMEFAHGYDVLRGLECSR
jgi:hypothetical protein